MDETINGFKDTELGPIPVDWEEERREADGELDAVLMRLGFGGWQNGT